MAVTGTILQSFDSTINQSQITGTLRFTGSYVTNGDTFDLTQLTYGPESLNFNTIPHIKLYEEPAAGTAPSGYSFIFCPGTTQANGVIAIMSAPATQFAAGAYNAALLAAVVRFEISAILL